MPISSNYPPLDVPKVDILTYLFPAGKSPSTAPLWIDSKDPDISLSPAQALQWIKRLIFGLERLGVKKGGVVLIFTPNHVFVPVAYLGIAGGGYVFSGANPVYNVTEFGYQLRNSEAQAVLVHPSLLQTTIAAAEQVGLPKNRIFQFSDSANAPQDGIQDWRSMIGSSSESTSQAWPRLRGEAASSTIAAINYSSGTTGLPKGVCVSHYNLIANMEQHNFNMFVARPYTEETAPPQRWVGLLPLYHAYGQQATIMAAIRLNIPVYIMKAFVYTDLLATIQTYKVTYLHAVPPILVMLAKRPETSKYDISSIKDAICGAAPLSKELQNHISHRFGMTITQGWGMTEVTCAGAATPTGYVDDSGSVGFLLPNTEAKLLDDGKEVGVGERGELCVRGPQVCLGYWRNEEATKALIDRDGWLTTGDVAVYDESGKFWIVDRKKELIKVNGLQVAPAELEAVLLTHEHIADAAVVGITIHDEEWPRAYVSIQDASKGKIQPADIQEWIKTQVSKHKWLVGGVAFVNEVPKLASGKIQRKVMREWAKKDQEILQGTIKARF